MILFQKRREFFRLFSPLGCRWTESVPDDSAFSHRRPRLGAKVIQKTSFDKNGTKRKHPLLWVCAQMSCQGLFLRTGFRLDTDCCSDLLTFSTFLLSPQRTCRAPLMEATELLETFSPVELYTAFTRRVSNLIYHSWTHSAEAAQRPTEMERFSTSQHVKKVK